LEESENSVAGGRWLVARFLSILHGVYERVEDTAQLRRERKQIISLLLRNIIKFLETMTCVSTS